MLLWELNEVATQLVARIRELPRPCGWSFLLRPHELALTPALAATREGSGPDVHRRDFGSSKTYREPNTDASL